MERSDILDKSPRISLTLNPGYTLGITDGMVRLSCGLEHPDDIVHDLLSALERV